MLLDTGKFLFGFETVCEPQQLTYIDVQYTSLSFLFSSLNKMLKFVHYVKVQSCGSSVGMVTRLCNLGQGQFF
jgi:hypothetical protein